MHRLLFVAAALLVVAPRVAASDCMPMELSTEVATKPGATIVGDGGVLVGATYVNRATPSKTPGLEAGWRVRAAGGKLVAPKIVTIAPGLFVYHVEFTSQDKPVEIEDDQHVVVASVLGSKAKLEPYPAPKVRKIEYSSTSSRHSSQSIAATIDGAPPPGTWAIVITDAKGVARSWGRVSTDAIQYPYSHADCGSLPNGTNPPSPGDMVSVFWVNSEGRRSEASKPIKLVTLKPTKPNPF